MMPFMGLKWRSPGWTGERLNISMIPKLKNSHWSFRLCHSVKESWEKRGYVYLDMCHSVWKGSLSLSLSLFLHKQLYVSATNMYTPEDSGSEHGGSTWCLVSAVMTNRCVLLLVPTVYWWECTTIYGTARFCKLVCECMLAEITSSSPFVQMHVIKGIWLQLVMQTLNLSMFWSLTHLWSKDV